MTNVNTRGPSRHRHWAVWKREETIDRRTFLITSAAAATGAALGTAVAAETEGPFGATGVPLPLEHGEGLPLGPLSNSRYPDAHIETLDRRIRPVLQGPVTSSSEGSGNRQEQLADPAPRSVAAKIEQVELDAPDPYEGTGFVRPLAPARPCSTCGPLPSTTAC